MKAVLQVFIALIMIIVVQFVDTMILDFIDEIITDYGIFSIIIKTKNI
jgi:preprotein translocase subunit SecY